MHQTIEQKRTFNIIETIVNIMDYFFRDFYAFTVGCIVSFIGYLLPVKNIVNLIVLFFLLDVIFGYWAARAIKKEKFSVSIIWNHTIPRMTISIVLVSCCYLWDTTYNQQFVATYDVVGWFISGVLIYSIADNGYQITKWRAFTRIGNALHEKVKDTTGMDINDKTNYDDK